MDGKIKIEELNQEIVSLESREQNLNEQIVSLGNFINDQKDLIEELQQYLLRLDFTEEAYVDYINPSRHTRGRGPNRTQLKL